MRVLDADDACDPMGPFLVISREFPSANHMLFEGYAEAHLHALWLARSTPGFTYMICAPIGFITHQPHRQGEKHESCV